MNFSGVFVVVGLLILSVAAEARTGFSDFVLKESRAPFSDLQAVMDSLREVEPWFQRRWLAERGLQQFYQEQSWEPDSQGLRCVGRWSYGPSVKVSLRVTSEDTIICLARGSGASLIRFRSSDSLSLELLSDINCYGVVSRAIIMDTLVFCGMKQGGTGIEVWGASNLESPNRLSYVYLPPIMDIAVKETLLFAIGYQQDSLRIFNVRDPRNPIQVGACADSGFPMCVSGNYCYLADQYGLNIVDVNNPRNPHRVSNIGGFEALSVGVKDTLCYLGTYIYPDQFRLRVYNVRNPASPVPVGSLAGIEAPDIYFPPTCDTVLYTPKLHIINISDPRNPRQIGFADCPGWDYGVITVPALNYALVADYFEGLVAVNITNPVLPVIDTAIYAADQTLDIEIDRGLGILASYHAGMVLVDFTNPEKPRYLGSYDTVGSGATVTSVAGRDSFVYLSWPRPRLISVDISDPTHPVRAGGCENMFNPPEDMVLRESFVYCAEANRFQVVNIARPREPRLVGSGVIQGTGVDLLLCETLAYVSSLPTQILNVRDPANPALVGTIPTYGHGIAIRDTFAFVPALYDSMVIYNISNPTAPVRVARHTFSGGHVWNSGVTLVDTLLYVGGDLLHILDISDPFNPREVGIWVPPYDIRRLVYAEPYLYAACYEAGICVLETVQVGVKENQGTRHQEKVSVVPSITSGVVWFIMDGGLEGTEIVEVYNPAGIKVKEIRERNEPGWKHIKVDLSKYPGGVYIVRLRAQNKVYNSRVVKTKGR